MANLYAQVQVLEQRVLMLEQYILQLSLHLNPNGASGSPMFNPEASGFFGPRHDRGFGHPRASSHKRPDNWSDLLQHEVQFNEVTDEISVDADLASLAQSVEGMVDTDVSGPGGFSLGDDLGGLGDDGNFGDAGDVGGDDGGDDGGDF